jgi:2-keto-4-pentenoate hydratase/2-oxohepta-3-ene-1,7-dioic acid hydratase in catechol pathway
LKYQKDSSKKGLKIVVHTFVSTSGKREVSDQETASDELIAAHCNGLNHTLLTPRYQNVLVHPKIITVINIICTPYNYDAHIENYACMQYFTLSGTVDPNSR